MEQIPSESNNFSASQEIPHILWNPKFHYRIKSFLYPTDALKNIKIYIKIYIASAATCFDVTNTHTPTGLDKYAATRPNCFHNDVI
jgi:hypothetical protein